MIPITTETLARAIASESHGYIFDVDNLQLRFPECRRLPIEASARSKLIHGVRLHECQTYLRKAYGGRWRWCNACYGVLKEKAYRKVSEIEQRRERLRTPIPVM